MTQKYVNTSNQAISGLKIEQQSSYLELMQNETGNWKSLTKCVHVILAQFCYQMLLLINFRRFTAVGARPDNTQNYCGSVPNLQTPLVASTQCCQATANGLSSVGKIQHSTSPRKDGNNIGSYINQGNVSTSRQCNSRIY